jgi:hypothetical protein
MRTDDDVTSLESYAERSIDLSTARATDPDALGWMVGSPPPRDKLIRYEDGSFSRFPQWRWSFSHWRELVPTVAVGRGTGRPHPLRRTAVRSRCRDVLAHRRHDANDLGRFLIANYTDGIVICIADVLSTNAISVR